MEIKNYNIIQIDQMINSAIQQGNNSDVHLTKEQAETIQEFITSIDDTVDILKIKNVLINNKSNARNLIHKYFDMLTEEMKTHRIEKFNERHKDNSWGNRIYESVTQMQALRDKFLELFIAIYEYDGDPKQAHNLLKELLQFNFIDYEHSNNKNSGGYLRSDNYRVFLYELFLYLTAYLIKEEKFSELEIVLHTPYQVLCITDRNSSHPTKQYRAVSFCKFNISAILINDEFRRNKLEIFDNRNLYVEMIKEKNKGNTLISLDNLKEADVLLYFLSLIKGYDNIMRPPYWSPRLAILHIGELDLMLKATSRSFFEKIKGLFGVSDETEFQEKLSVVKQSQSEHYNLLNNHGFPDYESALNIYHLFSQP